MAGIPGLRTEGRSVVTVLSVDVTSSQQCIGHRPRDGYLDAARECILDSKAGGAFTTWWRRRAGVSRMTIYRVRHGGLLGDLMTREVGRVGRRAGRLTGEPTPRAIADTVIATIAELRGNRLFTRSWSSTPS